MPNSLLACRGGGGDNGGGAKRPKNEISLTFRNKTRDNETTYQNLDDTVSVNLTGITDIAERNIKVAWNGWEPAEETKKEWRDWYLAWKEENEKNGEGKNGKEDAAGAPPGDFRGPGSGWPKLPGWADLGKGNPGVPIPPWAYVPKNIGRPNICYLPPVKGECRPDEEKGSPGERFGFNPYTNKCESYEWSGCGGTRNKFLTKAKCETHCTTDPPESCSATSGIPDKQHGHPFDGQ